ncbi:hypothetical protein BABINDRAFT_159517 [Babjeviella inositovora NRRL Y-12698]|uniref:3-ketodihydrosphingosine reductase TSC10 n=1 Tax=Babjeviella inositovora NRRL Y-12698 TaxID=984486 RepID=A0A1E3QZL0_9ASCO|nr:uncharacterized protein BABINDRAFT_159517 [Babjeviella inositovora NRRL Y-12698]ODQ83051.1 hypothetical protein BABINDRAFT_159517 [Babjeviella inositovora NRRL Y-12698]
MTLFGNNFKVKDKLVVITGGSQGVGAEFAKQLFNKGADVIIISRTASKLKSVCDQISQQRTPADTKNYIEYIVADVSEYKGCQGVFEHELLKTRKPDIVMCCAGSSAPGLFLDLTPESLESGVKTNYNTAVYFAHAALKHMTTVSDGQSVPLERRHLVVFSSVVAFFPFIGYGQYAPLKAGIRALSDVLRQECIPYNIRVSAVFPGNFDSEGYVEENKTKPEITSIIEGPSEAISCELCVKKILSQLEWGYEMVTTDNIGWVLGCSMLGASPRSWWLFQAIMAFIFALIAPVASGVVNWQIKHYFKHKQAEEVQKKDD